MATLPPQQLSDSGLKERFFRYFQHEVTGEHASTCVHATYADSFPAQRCKRKSTGLETKQSQVASVQMGWSIA